MEKIKLFVISNGVIPKMMGEDHYILQTGSKGKASISYSCERDDTYENISEKNSKYAELTGLYWIWKNQSAEYLGILQYKRRFAEVHGFNILGRNPVVSYHVLTSGELIKNLQDVDIIVAEEYLKDQTVDEQFRTSGFSYRGKYPGVILDAAEKVIKNEFPLYYDDFKMVMSGHVINPHNMLVAKKEIFDAYCSFLFPILEKLDQYVPVGFNDKNYNRMYGWLAERMMGVFLKHEGIPYKHFAVVDIENTKLSAQERLIDFLKRGFKRFQRK